MIDVNIIYRRYIRGHFGSAKVVLGRTPVIRDMRSDMAVCKEVVINRLYTSTHQTFKADKQDKLLDLGGNTGPASTWLFNYLLLLGGDLRLALSFSLRCHVWHHLRACGELLRNGGFSPIMAILKISRSMPARLYETWSLPGSSCCVWDQLRGGGFS